MVGGGRATGTQHMRTALLLIASLPNATIAGRERARASNRMGRHSPPPPVVGTVVSLQAASVRKGLRTVSNLSTFSACQSYTTRSAGAPNQARRLRRSDTGPAENKAKQNPMK